jgi:hypothetical protein
MMQDPYVLDMDVKYKQEQYLHEAVNERLLREIRALHDGRSTKCRPWFGIQIIIKVIFQTREDQPQQIPGEDRGFYLENSAEHSYRGAGTTPL